MAYWKNTSGSTFERPGDGVTAGWTAEPDDVVESDSNPAPGSFDQVETVTAAPTSDTTEPVQAADTAAPAPTTEGQA